METQDHEKADQSGHEGHSAVHVCYKCGWPFPNAHPSARHRRAHKRVCGTIEGYKLDSSQDKTHLDGSDGERLSDDDHKITSDKVMDRTISRKSSSGVGSRSSRSTKSEDEVFADADTEFGDGTSSEVSSDGVISRGNSLQSTKPESSKLSAENSIADDSSASSVILEDKQLQTVQTFEGKNDNDEVETPSEDQISSSINNPALVSASVTRENENAVEQNLMQSTGTSNGLDTGHEEHKEIAKSNELSEKTPCNGTVEDASEHFSAYGEVYISAGGTVKPTGTQSTVLEGRDEGSHRVDSFGNFHAPLNTAQELGTASGNARKSLDLVEDHEPKIEANENADLLDVSNALPEQDHPEIAVEDLDHEGEKINISVALEAPSAVERLEDIEDMLKQEAGQTKVMVEQEAVGGLNQQSILKASYGDISGLQSEEVREEIRDEAWEDQEVSSTEEQKSFISSENVFSEVTTAGSGHDQETSAYRSANAIDVVKDGGEQLVCENGGSKVPVRELSITSSTLTECSVDDITPQVQNLMNASDSDDVGNVEKVGVNGRAVGLQDEKETMGAAAGCGLIFAGSNDDNDEPIESESSHDSKLEKILDSCNLMLGHSQSESGLTPQGVRKAQSASENVGGRECMNKVDAGPVVETNDSFDSTLKMSEEAVSFCPSSTAAIGSCTEKFAEHASDVTESNSITKEHTLVSAVDVMNSSGRTDNQDGNFQFVSVPSATLDAFPATNIALLNSSQASTEPGAVSLAPKAMEEVQHPERNISLEPPGLEKTECTSEIQIFESQKQTALKTLLGEAIAKSREESPNYDEIPGKNLKPEATKEKMGKEWNSRARYPVKIKTEKKKVKSRSYWAPFLCCSSSVNATGP